MLISGKEAKLAWANGEELEYYKDGLGWIELRGGNRLDIFDNFYEFRLKPRTITINGIEVPAPLKQKSAHSNWDKTFVLRVGRCEYEYENEQDYILVRDTLESIFK